ncbi:MAG TPA: hypothetical protein VN673_09340, partial [Clostridia bacterium]|nr:hypothetical protein [Clostridia bacterium]
MKDEFAIESPTDVQQFLAEMPAPSRRNGDALYNGGMVTGLRAELPGFAYRAEVKDSRGVAEVSLFVDQETWDANCSCAQGFDCPHIYAAFRALLTEYRSAAVQALSASGRVGGQAISLRQPNKALPVATLLEEALGRKLIVQERGFALAVHEAYLETVANRALFEHSLVHIPLEWHLRKLSWTRLEIWPAFPVSEHEFWLYVALYAREQGVDIPDFMQPVTDVTLIEQRVKKWRRDRRIQEWRNRLQTQTWDLRPEPAEPSELRVRIEKDKAQLEMWNPAKERFDSFSQGGFRKLVTGVSVGEIRLSPESQSFFQVFNAEYEPVLSFDEEGRLQQLNPLFRLPALASRIVDSDGQPLARPEEPLEWRLLPGAAADDDYALALRTAAGEPPGTILCVLQGSPFLYLTAHTVYKGPVLFPFLDTEHENQVPAAVIETSSGIGFVKRLGAELPPALSKRVVEIPFHVTLHLSLRPASHGRGTEDCQVTALASTLDGRETKLWNGSTWVPQTSAKRVRSGEEIPVADESLLAKLPALLETLKLKPDFMGKALSTRVTKRFPERV